MRSSRLARLAGGGFLGGALLALFFRGVDWKSLGAAFRSADALDLLGVVALTIITYVARAWRWGYLLAPLASVPLRRLFSVTVVGFMSGLIVPRAGEVVRPYLVARRHGIRASAAFATIVLERLVDLITVLVLFGLYLYVLPMPGAQVRGPLLGVLKLSGALAGVGALAVLAVLFAFHVNAARAMAALDGFLSRFPRRLAAPVGHALRAFGEGLAVLEAPPRHLTAILGQSLVVWLSIAMCFFVNNRAFGLGLPFHASFLLIGFLTVGVAVPTPGMVGGFHEAYLLALTQAYGVDKGRAAAAGIAAHALTNLPILFLGLALLGAEGIGGSGTRGSGLTLGSVAEMVDQGLSEPRVGDDDEGRLEARPLRRRP